jgi:PAS domain S-box-containing protein
MKETLSESEAQYRILFESNPHPMWVYDSETLGFMAVNAAAVRHYGYSRNQFLGMSIKDIRDAEHVPALLESTTKDDAGLSEIGIWKHRKQDGTPIDVEITSHGIVFGGKQAQLVLAHDVTERLRAQRQLQEKADELASMTQQLWQASKLATMGELAASVAHELNNPLATVSLRAETLLDQLDGDERKQRSLQIIIGEVERMAKLVTNLLQFTRRSHRQVSTIDVQEEITRSLDLISHYLRNRKIDVVTEIQESLPPIIADRQQLRQVFLNIMTNASDAMPHGGTFTVRVHCEKRPATIVIEFIDTGEGIDADNLEKIWEPFYTSKAEGKGTGLGLPICSRIVEEHGGSIMLESEVGKGTTVRIVLPVAAEPTVCGNESEVSLPPSISPEKQSESPRASASETPKARAVGQGRW